MKRILASILIVSPALFMGGEVGASPTVLAPAEMDRVTAGVGAAALVDATAYADFLATTHSGTFTQVLSSPYSKFNPLGGMSAAAAGHAQAVGVGGDTDTNTRVDLAVDVPGGKVYSVEIHAQGKYVEFSAAAKVALPQPFNPLSP